MMKPSRRVSLPSALAIVLLALPGMATAIIQEDFFQAAVIDDRYQGKMTASGVPYEREDFVITHPYLPLGTRVQVTHLQNEQSVVADVIDRPSPIFHNLGLSAAVARELGILPETAVEVSITTQIDDHRAGSPPDASQTIAVAWKPSPNQPARAESAAETGARTAPDHAFRLQFGAFSDPANAGTLQRSLRGMGIPAEISAPRKREIYRVLSRASYTSGEQARAVAELLMEKGLVEDAIPVR